MEFGEADAGTYEIHDIGGRGLLLDTRNGQSWILCGLDRDKAQWKPIRWPQRAEQKPGEVDQC